MLALSDVQLAHVTRAAELVTPAARATFMQNVAALLDNVPRCNDDAILDAVMTALSWRGVAVGRGFFRDGAPPRQRTIAISDRKKLTGGRCGAHPVAQGESRHRA